MWKNSSYTARPPESHFIARYVITCNYSIQQLWQVHPEMRSKLNIQKIPKTRNQKLFEIWLLFFSSRIPGFRSSQGHGQEDAPVGRWSREWLGLGHGMNPCTKWGFAGKSMVNLFGEDDGRCSTPYRVSIDSILWILFPPIFSGWCFQQTASDMSYGQYSWLITINRG